MSPGSTCARSASMTAAGVLDQCEAPGAEAVIGNQIDGQVGMLCAVAFGAAHRATTRRAGELSNYLDVADDLLVEPGASP
ncbi:hypothetical protein [Streptomyces sp. NPDC059916]|uniref:hypothetical protein n=1 Tax=Streptomyces sp. NPDC059916 TaxID=3347001 RepID=UPI0036BB8547